MTGPYRLFDERLIDDEKGFVAKGDGRHLVREYDGASLFAVVRDGSVVNFEAERDGATVATTTLRLEPDPTGESAKPVRPTCYKCMCFPEGCACWEIDC